MIEGAKCFAEVGHGACQNKAKVERDGRLYCTIHDPERRKKRHEESLRLWEEKAVREAWERDMENALKAIGRSALIEPHETLPWGVRQALDKYRAILAQEPLEKMK